MGAWSAVARAADCVSMSVVLCSLASKERTRSLCCWMANTEAKPKGENFLAGQSNYLLGNDRKQWRTGVSQFSQVQVRGVSIALTLHLDLIHEPSISTFGGRLMRCVHQVDDSQAIVQ
jgi:hypothetical protein